MSRDWLTADEARAYNAMAVRNATIEECARVADEFRTHTPGTAWIMDEIADAIRALKDK